MTGLLLAASHAFAADPAAKVKCQMKFSMKGWSVLYKRASGTGTVTCSNGQSATVKLEARGGGLTAGKSSIENGHGEFSAVKDIEEIFGAYAKVDTSDTLYQQNLQDIQNHLLRTRKLPLEADDLKGIEYVYHAFYWYGPIIQYWSSTGGRGFRDAPTYVDLMIADDGKGQQRSFLATEENFKVLKELHSKNLFVPVVGNFAGPKALRAVGRYVKDRNALVSAFYLSNVEQYLSREGRWYVFCANVATLPLDPSSTFIRSVRNGMYGRGVGLDSVLGSMSTEVKTCGQQR